MKLVLGVVLLQIHVALLMVENQRNASTSQTNFRQTDLLNPENPQTLIIRRGTIDYPKSQAMKPRGDTVLKAPRCSRLKENCAPVSHSRCCDPCAFCHCRFFNTICRCWRLGRSCLRNT
ncbi:agouti-signaling protein-like [Tachysurus fulvidraco]|uniref:agouti-signaling protein-like n=1 Tax=Tachysurus fulvidraco TaxID=1234273 RepID=UPI001FEF706E|nr:agouti-signaling protein-like [Tachysurus fulvidraco]